MSSADGKKFQILSQELQLTDGPSKWELMLGLFDRHDSQCRKVTFKAGILIIEANIASVESEDGSGESWNITGWVLNMSKPGDKNQLPLRFKMYFRTDRRKGSIKL